MIKYVKSNFDENFSETRLRNISNKCFNLSDDLELLLAYISEGLNDDRFLGEDELKVLGDAQDIVFDFANHLRDLADANQI